ncbi:MAG: L-threonylcarbamoyladenylate synthase, partial [Gemmatimonadaceae bacterium]
AFWPGPLTMVLPRRAEVADIVSAGLGTVAVRVPAHPVALALLAACGLPVAAPSANRSMLISPTTGTHVAKSLGDAVDLILDAGPTMVGIESTVIDLTTDPPTMLRPGMIAVPDIEAIIGPIDIATHTNAAASRPSPGMMDRHYSPRGRLVIVAAADLPEFVRREREAGSRIGALLIETVVRNVTAVRMPADPAGYAADLYRALHSFDDAACSVIVVERVPSSAEWFGVRDRLERASRSA